ncbi:phosphatidylserine decarboxylase [Fervidicella metallireducens AeB]|uniref:Phosphatidylserine decarboxylase proenzyme n=1 Tax=Fervidicella metallireducens AeB TaxID=1403537 RepID=A0A017RWY1_9CLOT|nr:phosphatidylserine decarboxylase family protein [Fervidicella metallireducens]EYE89056.1 phosphatidylserine decarboxylase [Fervidicella metallireducens AeB]
MSKLPLRKESLPYLIFLSLLAGILYYVLPVIALIPIILLIFILYFFRDPERPTEFCENHILSPADGTVMEISEIYDEEFFNGKAIKISIFLSIFNVHVNRSPISGEVIFTGYRPGKYLPAFKSHASELNERNTIGIENKRIKVLVHQITGIVARRIVCWSKKGDFLKQGERFGLIKFGSCTEILVPSDVEIKVKKGDIVRGGITILGVIK